MQQLFQQRCKNIFVNYGLRLQAALKSANKSRKDLALAIGTSSQAIGMVITSAGGKERSLSTENHTKAADFLGVNPHWLATGNGEMVARDYKLIAEPGHYEIPKIEQQTGEPSPSAMELAYLYDEIPASDRVRRARAFNAASAAILDVLQESQSNGS